MTCIDAFKNLNVVYHRKFLKISPCCVSKAVSVDKIDFYNNSYLEDIRKEWRNGQWPDPCINCKNTEGRDHSSRRQGSNQWYIDNNLFNDTVELLRIDYWTGDLCNLACVICGPHNSSKWKQELNIPIESQKLVANKFWKDLDISQLQFIHFHGGEPLLNKEHIEFLKAIPDKSTVTITYNTNATVLPSHDLLLLWKQFKLVHLDFSIDDIEERFEYQRYPAIWNEVVDNLNWYYNNMPHNVMFGVNTAVGILNQSNLENLSTWLKKNFYATKFTDPIEHRTQFTIGNFSIDSDLEQVKKYLDAIDRRRGTNWKKTFPELAARG